MDFDLDKFVSQLIKRAPELRAAGVLGFAVDGINVQLAPAPAPTVTTFEMTDQDEGNIEAERDPAMYPGGRVPTLTFADDQPPKAP